jgi:hypothetical protein
MAKTRTKGNPFIRKFQRRFLWLSEDLYNAGYYRALKALVFAHPYHRGFRKDGKTPTYRHQVGVCRSLYNDRRDIIKGGLDPDIAIACGALHDLTEENPYMSLRVIEEVFGSDVLEIVLRMDKNRVGRFSHGPDIARILDKLFNKETWNDLVKHGWEPETLTMYQEYMGQILGNPYSLLGKLHDRGNNIRSIRYLPPKAQPEYLLETQKLSEAAEEGIKLYPDLGEAFHKSRTIMSASQNMYLEDCQFFANDLFRNNTDLASFGKSGEVISVLGDAGMISVPSAPRPSSSRGRLLRPAEP